MFRNSHKLHMGVSHLFYILGKSRRYLSVIVKTFFIFFCGRMLHPGTNVYLINRYRLNFFIKVFPLLHPFIICPLIIGNVRNPGSCPRTQLCFICIRVCLIKLLPVRSFNIKFIELSFLCPRDKQFINAYISCFLHWICLCVPVIKFTDNRNAFCIGRPYCKINAFFSFYRSRVCPQFFIYFIMCSLSKKILVKLCKLHFFLLPVFLI